MSDSRVWGITQEYFDKVYPEQEKRRRANALPTQIEFRWGTSTQLEQNQTEDEGQRQATLRNRHSNRRI